MKKLMRKSICLEKNESEIVAFIPSLRDIAKSVLRGEIYSDTSAPQDEKSQVDLSSERFRKRTNKAQNPAVERKK